jgi:hypothetical protein
MSRSIKYAIRRALTLFAAPYLTQQRLVRERQALLIGRLLAETLSTRPSIRALSEVEFTVFSQFGDDGIIQWLCRHLEIPHRTFVEFGVEDYRESNTRFLLMNDNWSGFVMDSSESNISRIVTAEYFWRHDLAAKRAFADMENINALLAGSGFHRDVGLLHIDIDGNDYWIWKAIDVILPIIVVLEYNSLFGPDKAVTVPYDKTFDRTKKHYSNLYFGASLPALYQLSYLKGYAFVGSNSAGNNAYFVRRDKLNATVKESSLETGYVRCRFRQSRDNLGKLNYLTWHEQLAAIKGLAVYNTETDRTENL